MAAAMGRLAVYRALKAVQLYSAVFLYLPAIAACAVIAEVRLLLPMWSNGEI
jgi:hypothetical protein